jgi:tetratricopeptide (TPR) repeat protein
LNNKYKFKAYISYSHRDERWAKWLHRALESYRVPRKLLGTKTAVGKVPSRIRPVFRDRDDLSSASDLGGTVKQALADSENMIVICSLDAAASFWVNEEIRQFASLGRQKQIFCVIVDGDPVTPEAESTCFPAALAEIGLTEPLAADIRKWADGKRLSKLKLVSGMLGLPLDQLRRRDLQKRQKVWTLTTVASIALAAVLVTAVTARIAAQQRRDSGESLVTYKLKELRTMLNVADDPENLARLEDWNKQDLARLLGDAGVDESARSETALALREEGIEFWQNGNMTPALEKFQQSWALLAAGYHDDRSNHLLFFELGQAEYWIGQTYLDQGNLDFAEKAFMSYAEITRRLILLQPENAEWVLEMAYALTGLGILQKSRDVDNPDRTLQFMQSSLEYNQIALVLDPANEYYQSELGQSHANLADAQLAVCDLEGALRSRQEQVALDSALLGAEPENIDRMQRMVFALTGFASVKDLHGEIDDVMASLENSLELLGDILHQNVDDRDTVIDILLRKQYLVRVMTLKGETDEAWGAMNKISDKWQELKGISEEDMRTSLIYIEHLINQARLAKTRGDIQLANQLLNDIQLHLVASQSNMSFKRRVGNILVEAVFLQWEMNDELPPANILSHMPKYVLGSGRTRACDDASKAAIKALMLGQLVQAREFTNYLLEKGYREVGFMRVCKQYSLCSGQ